MHQEIWESIQQSSYKKTPFPDKRGIYAFFLTVPTSLPGIEVPRDHPLYIGMTDSSLAERDHLDHEDSGFSTLRRTIGSILKETLDLRAVPRAPGPSRTNITNYRFRHEDELKLTQWMKTNLVCGFACIEGNIRRLEQELIRKYEPLLNLTDWPNPCSQDIRKLRHACREEASKARSSQHGPNTRPLTGCRVLISRARKQAAVLSSALRELGCQVIEIPFIEIRRPRSYQPLDTALRNLATYDWLILTSVNGVEALFARMEKIKLDRSAVRHLRIAAIGPATKKTIEEHGLPVTVTPREYVAESVVRGLRRRVQGKRVLLVRAKVARDVIPRELRRAGATVDVIEAYQTVRPKSSEKRLRAALAGRTRKPHAITFTSSSTVRNFVALVGLRGARAALSKPAHHHGVHSVSIGPVTSATLREFGLPVDIEASEYTIPGLVAAIVRQSKVIRQSSGKL